MLQVPAGHVWLQGDNTINSTDSRHYGPVPYAMLVGKAFAKVTVHPLCKHLAFPAVTSPTRRNTSLKRNATI